MARALAASRAVQGRGGPATPAACLGNRVYLGEKTRVRRRAAACNPQILDSGCSATSINRRGDVGSARVARAVVELGALGEIVRTQPRWVSLGCVPVDPSCAKSAQRVVVVVGAKSQAKDIANRSGSAMS